MSSTLTTTHGQLPETARTLYALAVPKTNLDIATLACVLAATLAYLLRGYTWDKPDPYHYLYFERPQRKDGSAARTQQQNRNIATKMQEADKNVVVFWGSQSGVAEGFAGRLAKELHLRFGLNTMTADLSDYDAETIAQIPKSSLAFFVMSTYGEGDPSDNAQAFWEWINKSHDNELAQLRYAAFGLGNRNYKYYNRVIDVVTQALQSMGAEAILPVGKADDAQGATEEDFMLWKEGLFTHLRTTLGMEEQPLCYEASLEAIHDTSLDIIDLHDGTPTHSPAPKALPIISFKELFNEPSRNCLHMELDINAAPEMRYKTGDHLAVWPINPEAEVAMLIDALNLSAHRDTPMILRSLDSSSKIKFPSPTTITTLFRHYLEICAAPSRDAISALSQFAPTDSAKELLAQLSKDKDAHAAYVARKQLTLGRLMKIAAGDRAWTNLPLSFVIESLSPMQPRYYSISSSSVLSPRRIAITALVSKSALPGAAEENIYGVTTNYMLALTQSRAEDKTTARNQSLAAPTYQLPTVDASSPLTMFAHVRKSKFKLPVASSTPLIMIAAGTGLAPFRAFIAERAKLHAIGRPIGKMILFFGCRNQEEDYIYREEMEEAQRKLGKDVFHIVTAFSRAADKAASSAKIYVQDRVQEHAAELTDLVSNQSANLYICGRASMAREVGRRFGKMIANTQHIEESEADNMVTSMRKRGKWQEDVWG